jgi:hypothetical protein
MGPRDQSADQFIERLAKGCKDAGLKATVFEPSTKIKIHAPNGNAHFDEMITLRPDANEVLSWYWSWGEPICPAGDLVTAVAMIRKVVAG